MQDVPLEVIARHAYRKIGDFFAEQAEKERKNKKVAILVEDFTNSIYYIGCDEKGYPNFHHFNYMTFDSINVAVLNKENALNTPISMTVEEISILVEKPLLTQRYDWQEKPYVFMWAGRKISSRKIPLEKLNIQELQKLAQQAILNREGLIVDEALSNKIYK